MAEQIVVRGTVVGEEGVAVAGWVSLGKKLPQRWLSHTVRITSDEGHELTLEGLGADTIAPVTTREAAWSAIEGEELAKLCVREAPAPEVEVDFTTAVLRGGDVIVAWGDVLDRGYIGGDSQRGSVEGGITKLRAHVVAVGDDRESLLERGRERHAERTREQAAKAAKAAKKTQAKRAPKSAAPAAATVKAPGMAVLSYEHGLVVLAIAICVACAVVTEYQMFWLAAGLCALFPRAYDAVVLPRFRVDRLAPASLEAPFIAFVIAGGIGVLFPFMSTFGKNAKQGLGSDIATYIAAANATLAALWLTYAGQQRRRYCAILANAPDHPDPIQDGVWGKSVGTFSEQVLDVGAEYTTTGSGKNATTSSSPYTTLKLQAPLVRKSSGLDVQLGDAAILTLAKYGILNGIYQKRRGVFIDSTTATMVAGRATDGMLRKGGEASLLVFAAAPHTDVQRELARFRKRETVDSIFAVVGLASLAASFLL